MTPGNIKDLFDQAAQDYPDDVALAQGDRLVKYADLLADSNKLANFLISQGARKGSIVSILSRDIIRTITAMIGILKAGCAYAVVDMTLPEKRMEAMISEVSPQWFLIDSEFGETLSAISKRAGIEGRVIPIDGSGPPIAGPPIAADSPLTMVQGFADFHDASAPQLASDPDDICYIYFTSGSTGRPKGIAGRLKGIDHFIRWEVERLSLGRGTRVSQLLPLTFDGSLRDVFVALAAGGTVCIPEDRETILDAGKLIDWLDRERVNIIHCVPSLFRSIINEGPDSACFGSLKCILLAGEALLPSDVKRWMDIFGERTQLVNLYGTSETTMAKFFYFVKPSDTARRSIPIGEPMPGARALVIDERGRPCPAGTIGEIYIRTPYRSLGYYNRPELTAELFAQNPFNNDPTDIIYKTGDLGRMLDDGNFEFIGRKDQQVKVRGRRVELGEIENLLRSHEAVSDLAVIDQNDQSGNNFVCAYLVLEKEVELEQLREYLAEELPDYMVPSVMLVMDKLPKTITGKIDRRALPSLEHMLSKRQGELVAPRNTIEEMLASIWSRVLGIKTLGIHDNFFHLGGHSLLATQVASRIRQAFQVELPLQTLFEVPTIAGLGARIEQSVKAGLGLTSPPLRRASSDGPMVLSFAQQRLWFIDKLEPGSPAYNIDTALRLRGKLGALALEQSLNEIIRRHNALRTTFSEVEGRPVQSISPFNPDCLPLVDLSRLDESRQGALVKGLAREAARRSFDLASGPLISAALLKLSEEDHVGLFTMHHIIGDAWSASVLVREVGKLYEAFQTGSPSSLEELRIQYADFAAWQRDWLRDDALEAQLSYWREKLGGKLNVIEITADKPRPATRSNRGAIHTFALSAELSDSAKKSFAAEGATLFMTLLAAFNVLLSRYTGSDDIVVGTDVAGRNRDELEDIIGFFVNQLVLRTDLSGDPTFRQIVSRVREAALGAYAHQDLPFERLVEELKPERDLSRTPLFQIKMILQNVPRPALELPSLTVRSLEVDSATAPFDLIMTMVETPEGIIGELTYSTDLFEADTIAQMITRYKSILEALIAEPDQPVSQVRLLSGEETGGMSASDFPDARLTQGEFESLLLEISGAGGQE